jgi:4-amino-4-deoxy-L-arabinose transferase-like glycosyltransferase
MRLRHIVLLTILVLYALLGVLFAARTPAWQAPDEPAHYNYIRFVATTGGFPVLQMGDYPHGYLEEIKRQKFPPDLGIEAIRYEFHQPPLYYTLLAPIYRLTQGALLPLRLASVLLGACVVVLAYAITRRVLPGRVQLALGVAAFVAFLPQHLATVAQVGNDVLAEVLFAAVLYLLVGWVMGPGGRSQESRVRGQGAVALGVLLGLILVTKTTAYIAVPLAGGVLVWRWWQERAGPRRILMDSVLVAGPMLVIGLPWLARGLAVYGWPDFLGLIRHDQIVVGQTRTGEYLAQVGWNAYLRRAVEFTFKSFWGVFGWLGVFMDSRAYFVAALLSGVGLGGIVLRIAYCVVRGRAARSSHRDPVIRNTHYALRLLTLSVFLTALTYIWYNTQFVQHQGRYLFTALIPLAIAFAVGWAAAVAPRAGRIVVGGLGLVAVALAVWGILSHTGLPKWPIAMTIIFAAGFAALDLGALAVERLLKRPPVILERLAFAVPFCILPLLSLYALFGAIVPQLAR